jgi:hypothetical protein
MKASRPNMRAKLTTLSCVRAVLGLALGVGLLAVSTAARAGDDDVPIDTKIFRSIMHSLGLKSADDPQINYQERPPLVIPADETLPPPQTTDAATKNPAWPKDPDVARAKLEKKRGAELSTTDQMEHEGTPLRPEELTPGAKTAARVRHPNATNPSIGSDGTVRLNPSELGYKGGLFGLMFDRKDEENVKFTGEPPRASLTEPPPGYQTPSPDQPYGNVKAAPPKADNSYVTRGEVNPGR